MTDIHFNNWVRHLEQSRLGKHALQALQQAFPADEETRVPQSLRLRDAVLSSCYAAAMFNAETDPGQLSRAGTRAVLIQLPRQRDAVATMRNFIALHPTVVDVAAHRAMLDLKSQGIGIGTTDGKMRRLSDLFDCLLEAYGARLTVPLPLCGSGPALRRFTYGCLIYEEPIDRNKCNKRPRDTMLLFDLVQTFRLRSAGVCRRWRGERMPAGKSHYGLVARLINATLRESRFDASSAKNVLKSFLKQNPGVGFIGWPAVPASTSPAETPVT